MNHEAIDQLSQEARDALAWLKELRAKQKSTPDRVCIDHAAAIITRLISAMRNLQALRVLKPRSEGPSVPEGRQSALTEGGEGVKGEER